MAHQICTPTRVFKPVQNRYLFLGCSILKVTATIGWNEQVSEVDVDLVQDPCTSTEPKIYYDANLIQKTTTAADPGFISPIVGSPALLILEGFEFCGLVQSWQQTNNDSGNPTFTVKLTDPRPVLEGTQLIISDYAGGVFGAPNIINVYGYAESFGQVCPLREVLGGIFGSPAGGFGGAQVNDNGMRWSIIKEATSILTSSIPVVANKFSAYGRLIYRASGNPGYGLLKADYIDPVQFPNQTPYKAFYFVDLSEIPVGPTTYRLTGTNISLLEAISQVCEDAGCDYYVELVPVRLGNSIIKIIKVRVVVRGQQPLLGQIELFIEETGNVISKNIGRELRNEATSKFVIGTQVDSIFQADETLLTAAGLLEDDEDIIKPFWGVDRFGNIIPTEYDSDNKLNFTVDITSLNSILYEPLNINSAKITEYELQAALAGQDAWLAMASSLPSDLGNALQIAGVLDAERVLDVLNRVVFAHHLIIPGKKAGPNANIDFADLEIEAKKLKDLETIYNFVLNYARDFYGKKYLVRVPYTCCRIDDESRQTVSSESPSDSGWTEYPTVIGLTNPAFMDIFKEDNGKILPFARWDDASNVVEISNIPEEDYLLFGSKLFLKASTLLQTFVYEDFRLRFNPHTVIELSVPILERLEEDDLHRTKKFADKFFELAKNAKLALGLPGNVPEPDMRNILKRSGNSLLHLGIFSSYKKPDAIAAPIHSNVTTYGPWVANGPPGLSVVEKDDGLAPWEYGSVNQMDVAGINNVNQGITYMQVSELGSVTIPGYPALRLGDELRFGGISALENRAVTSNRPIINENQRVNKGFWDASSGVVPNINPKEGEYYKVSKSGTTSIDGNSSWSNNDLIVFNNGKWEKQSALNSLFITFPLQQWTGAFGPNITGITIDIGEQGVQTTYSMRTYTPKFGRFSKTNADRLKEYNVLINSVRKEARLVALTELKIKTNRERAQERLFSNRTGNVFSGFAASPPGVLIGQILTNEDDLKSTAVHLIKHNELMSEVDEYANKAMMSLDGLLRPVSKNGEGGFPQFANYGGSCVKNISVRPEPPVTSYTPFDVSQSNLDPWANGHDIDILARGTEIPDNLSIQLDDSFESDYRGFALKGPLIIQQWGFDLQGKPIPNSSDTETAASGGNFNYNGLTDSFLNDYLRKPHTWPVAPVDLRYDRARGVWTAAQPYRLVRATILSSSGLSINGTSCMIIDGNAVENASGSAVEKLVTIYAISSQQKASQGDTIVAEYDTVSCRYYAIEVPNIPGGGGSVAGGFPIFIGKAIENSANGQPHDSVKVHQCVTIDGTEVIPLTTHTVHLLKHHTGGDSQTSKFHKHDIRIGDIIAYAPVGISGQYVGLSDYSHEHSIFLGKATKRSVAPEFPDFKVTIKQVTGQTTEVDVKNRLRQPILTNDCCYVYRHKDLQPDTIEDEYWLMQGQFSPVCVIDNVSVRTDGSAINTSPNDPNDGLPDACAFSNNLTFTVSDIILYEEAAHQVNPSNNGSTYLTSCMDIEVSYQCCSVYQSGYIPAKAAIFYNLAFTDLSVGNECGNDGSWVHVTQSQTCDIEDVEFDE